MLVALSPEKPWEFLAAMSQAWEWTQARPWAYCDAGAYQSFDEYLADAKEASRRHFAVIHEGRIMSVIHVWLVTDGQFEIHMTSTRKASPQVVLAALQTLLASLFNDLNAQSVQTTCGIYRGHLNRGVARLAEVSGLRRTETTRLATNDSSVVLIRYEITREQFYERTQTRTDERL